MNLTRTLKSRKKLDIQRRQPNVTRVPKVNEFLSLAQPMTDKGGEGVESQTRTEPFTRQSEPERLTPLKAVRRKCIDCKGYELKQVRECDFSGCPFHSLRMGRGSRSVLKPIRSFCLWCCCGQRHEVKLCPAMKCPLWRYRQGRRPQTTGLLTKNGLTDRGSESRPVASGLCFIKDPVRDETASDVQCNVTGEDTAKEEFFECKNTTKKGGQE
jgi:hypothetical protein